MQGVGVGRRPLAQVLAQFARRASADDRPRNIVMSPNSWRSYVAQRKMPVDLHFIVRLRHKASGAALELSCAVCFEQPAGVFAGCGAVCQAKFQTTWLVTND